MIKKKDSGIFLISAFIKSKYTFSIYINPIHTFDIDWTVLKVRYFYVYWYVRGSLRTLFGIHQAIGSQTV